MDERDSHNRHKGTTEESESTAVLSVVPPTTQDLRDICDDSGDTVVSPEDAEIIISFIASKLLIAIGQEIERLLATSQSQSPDHKEDENKSRPQVPPVNGKRRRRKRRNRQRGQDIPASQHDDLIKFISCSWNEVSREFEHFNQNGAENSKGGPSVLYYVEQDPNPLLKDFEPFDLEAWWGKRIVENLSNSSNSSHSSHPTHSS